MCSLKIYQSPQKVMCDYKNTHIDISNWNLEVLETLIF